MWEYKGVIYASKKELKAATGINGCKLRAKRRDGEIKKLGE
jgi:hypothetical protein